MSQRLQKLIAASGLASRRRAEEWIAAGRVTVNGRVATLGESADPACDRIAVDGRILGDAEEKTYLLLYKPAGFVTTLDDPEGRPTVADLVRQIPARLYPVGRLDLTTEGVLLLTNDGALAQHLAHPRHQVTKTYLVRARGAMSEDTLRRLEQEVVLEDGPTAPAQVAKVRFRGGHTWLELTIHEGRNRQVRRMCEAVGHPVSRLKRIRFAFLDLKGLQPGQFRKLTPIEIERLKRL
jgi:23S rRNA pseudouridine2605 synthase